MNLPIHIPSHKQEELQKIVDIVLGSANKSTKIDMLILYGSYARGDFVEKDIVQEGHTTLEYKSDFDLLLITRKTIPELHMRLSNDINKKITKDKSISTPASMIVEDIDHVNARLQEGRYFYLDIKKEGVVLYDSKEKKLAEAKILSPKQRKKMQHDDFLTWFDSSVSFFEGHKDFVKRKDYNGAAFLLHQAAEKAITAYMLVKTSYKPKTHDLEILYTKLKELEPGFEGRFDVSGNKKREKQYFVLLKKAYVEARYSKEYKITHTQLKRISEKVLLLQEMVKKYCEEEIER